MPSPLPVTAVIINYRTADLTRRAVDSFRSFYPDALLLLIDNGSGDGSEQLLKSYAERAPEKTEVLLNPYNYHHGPAMNQALHRARTEYVLFLDSDCEVLKGNLIEQMLAAAGVPDGYIVGKKIFMNERGFDVVEAPEAHPYIRPICMLVKREQYLSLPPFARHGAPCLNNMIEARKRGLALVHFPVEEFIRHEGRGTAGRHGYHLGLRGKINHIMNRLGL